MNSRRPKLNGWLLVETQCRKEIEMKKALFLVLLLSSTLAFGQQYPTGEGGTTATSISPSAFPLLAPDGTAAAPSYSWSADTDMGCWRNNASTALLCQNQTAAAGRSYFQLSPEFNLLSVATIGASTVYGEFSCYQNTDIDCYIYTDDGTNNSQVTFANTGTTFTDQLFIPDGSFTAPAVAFAADPDAGIYYLAGFGLQNQNSAAVDGRTWSLWQQEQFLTTLWFDATPNGTASMRLGDLGTEEPGFQVFLDSAVGNDIEFTASTVGAEPEFSFVLNDGGAGDVEVLQMIDTAATFATPVFLPDGTAAAPSLSFTSQTDAGLNYQDSINTILLQTSETASFARLSMNGEAGTGTPYFQLDADDATKDVQIVGNAWSVLLNMSVDDGAGNSADFALGRYGPDFVDNGTRPTCTSSQRGVVWKEDSAAATEDTFETCMKMDDDNYAWIEATNDFAQSGTSTLTDASPTSLVRFAIAQGTFISGQIHATSYCDDGTNEVMLRMEHDFVCSNDAGTEACGFTNDGTPDTGAEASIGTASINTHDVLAASGAADTIDIQFDTDCSLTPTTFEAAWTVEFASGYSRTATEQN
jgi:hypothetical protein